jgi:hypothetical protein
MITAQQAREITKSSKQTLEEVLQGVSNMASNGHNFWASPLRKVDFTPEMRAKLIELGFLIIVNPESDHFKIEW